jgi:hypothetical protein
VLRETQAIEAEKAQQRDSDAAFGGMQTALEKFGQDGKIL